MGDTKSGQAFQKHTFNFQPRPYQVEIVEQAVKQNSIVCLATGTGKTFISAMVIKELYDWKHLPYKEFGKRIFFCVNTGKILFCLCNNINTREKFQVAQ